MKKLLVFCVLSVLVFSVCSCEAKQADVTESQTSVSELQEPEKNNLDKFIEHMSTQPLLKKDVVLYHAAFRRT